VKTTKRPPATIESGRTRSRVSHIGRGLHALEVLSGAPASAAQVAATLGVNRSSSLRLLQELEMLGYVRRDARTKRYSLVFERFVAMAAQPEEEWTEVVEPILEHLRDTIGETTILATPARGVMVYVRLFASPHSIAVRERIGTLRPTHSSAIGKAWLSALSPEEFEREVQYVDFSAGTSRAPRDAHELRERVARARAEGWAVDVEETVAGGSCVAVPVWVDGVPVAAACVSAPANRMDEVALARNGRLLKQAIDGRGQGRLRGSVAAVGVGLAS
jgi:DNA-binding IclR family transcriptional regulator